MDRSFIDIELKARELVNVRSLKMFASPDGGPQPGIFFLAVATNAELLGESRKQDENNRLRPRK